MLGKLKLLYSTIKHLKPVQIKYQVFYRLQRPQKLGEYSTNYDPDLISPLKFNEVPPVYSALHDGNSFTFLNLSKEFNHGIDWDFQEYGKLWNYNLQYLNYIFQTGISVRKSLSLINSLHASLQDGSLLLEPYPVSLRSINIIRLFSKYQLTDAKVLSSLHGELDFLSRRMENHLLGNHLLENAFALTMGGAFFSNNNWLKKGKDVLTHQLNEQILPDGGHFELSPMYHQIILFRLLELIDWYSKWEKKEEYFQHFLNHKAALMVKWLNQMTFKNGDIPHFNDSAVEIAYSTEWLLNYANKLGIRSDNRPLNSSGYRSYVTSIYECKIDCAQIGPSYQPGHAHADALSFILYSDGKPLLVEAGTSTYEANAIRQTERSTKSHNTVVVDGTDQSEVYGGFRVGSRAETRIISEDENSIVASHDGYKQKFNAIHTRTFSFQEDLIEIKDVISSRVSSKANFHLHPDIEIEKVNDSRYILGDIGTISFSNLIKSSIESYDFAEGFNKTRKGKVLVINFVNELNTKIDFNR
ncbi:heparinase II/III domain-containing protein [Albibacterium profundi]|uniref:Alginate lyase family protein n=1 Tax=Albibacterium profundi TaxID=3134906 RepID=A0ABV5C9P4_9SPHI